MANDERGFSPARLTPGRGGEPFSPDYDDYYSSLEDPLAEARYVFLEGNGLPRRWADRERFVIGETGFGTGLNFLTTWANWRETAPRHARLHFVSVEKHPFSRADLLQILEHRGHFPELARQLLAQYPPVIPGFHRLHLDGGRVTLTLLFGDVHDVLPELVGQVDAWYLDGFAPAKNPAMWTDHLYRTMARLSAPGATLATFTAAGHVRRGLQAAGFEMEKRKGFGHKRHMLVGHHAGGPQPPHRQPDTPWFDMPAPAAGERRAVVIGAGLAGSAASERLASRGWEVELIERHATEAPEASGNPAGIVMPVLSRDWNPLSRIACAGFSYALRHLQALEAEGLPILWDAPGVIRLARHDRHREQMQRILESLDFPKSFVRWLDRESATHAAGLPVTDGGWHFPDGAWVRPPDLVRANLERFPGRIRRHLHREAITLHREDGQWQVRDDQDRLIARAPNVVLANASDARHLAPAEHLPLEPVRGQISLMPATEDSRRLRQVVCREGYVIPAVEGQHCFGASFDKRSANPEPTLADHQGNLERLASIAPEMAQGVEADTLDGRVAFRSATPDRIPAVGPLADASAFQEAFDDIYLGKPGSGYSPAPLQPGLHVSLGHGSRGLVWSQLAGELLAAQIAGEPLPLEKTLVNQLNPNRFLVRTLKRNPRDR